MKCNDGKPCDQLDTSGMSQLKQCKDCPRYVDDNGVRATGALPELGLKNLFSWVWNHTLAIKTNRWYLRNLDYEYRWFYMPGGSNGPLFKLVPKTYQFVNWYRWKGFRFTKGDPNKQPAAFHLIYKWSLFLGWFEIRKFLNDEEGNEALKIYRQETEREAAEAAQNGPQI